MAGLQQQQEADDCMKSGVVQTAAAVVGCTNAASRAPLQQQQPDVTLSHDCHIVSAGLLIAVAVHV